MSNTIRIVQSSFAKKTMSKCIMARRVRLTGKPYIGKLCAVSRTERIANRVGRSSGHMTPRRTTNLDLKGKGDKSMFVKRGAAEDVYAAALQRLSDMAKAILPEPQSPAAERCALR
jgi:hypothetical protein